MSDPAQITRIIMYFLSGYLGAAGLTGDAIGLVGSILTGVVSLVWWFIANRSAKNA